MSEGQAQEPSRPQSKGSSSPVAASDPSPLELAGLPIRASSNDIQQLLHENAKLIQAIYQNQNLGKLHECCQYLEILQRNVLYLGRIADQPGQTGKAQNEWPPSSPHRWFRDELERLKLAIHAFGPSSIEAITRFVATKPEEEVRRVLPSFVTPHTLQQPPKQPVRLPSNPRPPTNAVHLATVIRTPVPPGWQQPLDNQRLPSADAPPSTGTVSLSQVSSLRMVPLPTPSDQNRLAQLQGQYQQPGNFPQSSHGSFDASVHAYGNSMSHTQVSAGYTGPSGATTATVGFSGQTSTLSSSGHLPNPNPSPHAMQGVIGNVDHLGNGLGGVNSNMAPGSGQMWGNGPSPHLSPHNSLHSTPIPTTRGSPTGYPQHMAPQQQTYPIQVSLGMSSQAPFGQSAPPATGTISFSSGGSPSPASSLSTPASAPLAQHQLVHQFQAQPSQPYWQDSPNAMAVVQNPYMNMQQAASAVPLNVSAQLTPGSSSTPSTPGGANMTQPAISISMHYDHPPPPPAPAKAAKASRAAPKGGRRSTKATIPGTNQVMVNMDKTTLFTPDNPPRPGSPRSPRSPKSPTPKSPKSPVSPKPDS